MGLVRSLHAASSPVVPLIKDLIKVGVKHPVVALPLGPSLTRYLDKAFIQRQIVPDRVLPPLRVLTLVVRELVPYPVVDLAQLQLLVRALSYGHG